MIRVRLTEAAELLHVQALGRLLLVARRAVVTTLALAARELNDVSHGRLLYFEASGSGLTAQDSRKALTTNPQPALALSL